MIMKKCLIMASILLLPAGVLAQEEGRLATSGQFTAGVQQDKSSSNSSKFNEYRDIRDGFYLYDLKFDGVDTQTGLYLDFSGKNLIREDQTLRFGVGDYGTWGLSVERNETPHNISNKAMTPFIDQGKGVYTLPSPIALPSTDVAGTLTSGYNLAPTAAQASAGLLRNNDEATSAWLETNLHGTDLGTQRDKTSATLNYSPLEALKFRLTYTDERKDGNKITYGPIGDRPPRTLDIQMTEPIDYATREVKFEAEYNKDWFQSLFAYTISDFENDIDTLRWQNPDARLDDPGSLADLSYDQWTGHRVANFGERALYPDNRYQNASLTLGFDLPLASRLGATVAFGKAEQDESLIPYATSSFGTTTLGSAMDLPRGKADAEIETTLLNLDYTINPIERLNLRAFFRYYDLDNNTKESDWHYVTSDTVTNANATTTGLPTYKNMRTNLAYAYDQQNYGLDATYSLNFWRTTLGLGFEREEIDRDYREADTDENMYKLSLRTRPANWLTLRAKYLYGDREGDNYDNTATAASYWYALGDQGTDNDNPQFTFSNHPDTRKYDVIDRERNQVDLAATVMPIEPLSLTASYRWQDDDYDAGVKPVQPLLDYVGVIADDANRNAATPGDQIGLLSRETERYGLDGAYAASERLTLTAFASRESIGAKQRGFEYNENNKLNPVTAAGLETNELGPWTRASSQWIAKTEDHTTTVGAGAGYQIIPGKLNFVTDYSFSHGKVDIGYSGFGAVFATDSVGTAGSPMPDDFQYAFRDPSTVTHKQYTFNATLEYQLFENLVVGVHYLFDRYKISDWMEESDQPWFESVGNEYLLRDSSSATSTQWGNRLVNMGSYLGPSYESHVGFMTLTYKF